MNLFYANTTTEVAVGDTVSVNEGGANVLHTIFGINAESGLIRVRANDEDEGHEVEADAISAEWKV